VTVHNTVEFCIYFCAELNSQGPITEFARIERKQQKQQTQGENKQIRNKLNQLRLFKFINNFLKLRFDLQTTLAAGTG
jgi:hypothetical protein